MIEKIALDIEGAFLFTSSVFTDTRGGFEVFWEENLFVSLNFDFRPESANHSYNTHKGTIRAFHYQASPHEQSKLVTCVSGRVWDVMVDLREDSPTRHQWSATELSHGDGKCLYIPAGCAHGFATLEDNSTVAYLIEGKYVPEASSVIRWNDPTLNVPWPISDPILSEKDRNAPTLNS
jgi:dTDP-4-dehydrorhamnose 3,5-epimerase